MKLNKKTLAVSVATLTIVGGTSAFAWFSAGGSGSGTGSVGAAAPEITVESATAAPITELDVAANVDVTLSATKNGAHITTIAVAVDTTSDDAVAFWGAGGAGETCDASWFSTTSSGVLDESVDKTPGTTEFLGADTGATLTLDSADDDQGGCLGLDNIPLTITVS